MYLAFFVKMSDKGLMTRRKREYRATQRDRYRRSVFISEYTRKKYPSIYKEADNFYQKLLKQYPTKTKLTACFEFKVWEVGLQKDYEPATLQKDDESATLQKDYEPPTSAENAIQLNIPLMNSADVQEMQTSLVFGDIYPSLHEEINPEIVNEVINEIRESNVVDEIVSEIEETNADIFNCPDEDMNDMIEDEINISLSELDPLEKELLKYFL